jgi:hypothetical protein
MPGAFSVIEHLPVAVPFNPLSVALQLRVSSVTVTCPVGVVDPAVVLGPVTSTPIETLSPTTGLEVTEVMVVVETAAETAAEYVNASEPSTATQKLAVGHETDESALVSISSGDDHVLPL